MIDLRFLESMGKLRKRSPDIPRARSLVESCESNMRAISMVGLNSNTSTIIFRETYESLRQLGDARWWWMGYEPKDHEASMKIIQEEKISRYSKLQKLDRFREIRNEANYSGYKVPLEVTKEILAFWDDCGNELLVRMKKDLKM